MKLAELEARTGVAARSIRFLIAEEILPRPEGQTRAAEYGEDHVRAIEIYLEMKAGGERSLKAIAHNIRFVLYGEIAPPEPDKEPALVLNLVAGINVKIDWAAAGQIDLDEAANRFREALESALADRKTKEPV